MNSKRLRMYSYFISFLICIIIGLPTFFTGCNLSVTNFCPNYDILNGYIYKTEVKEHLCSTSTGKITVYTKCWDVNTYASNNLNYNQSTNTCYYTIDLSDRNKKNADNQAEKYYIGKKVSWYKSKGSKECFNSKQLVDLWICCIFFCHLDVLFL